MTEDQYKVLVESIQACRDEIARVDRDLGKDREDIQEFSIRMGAVEDQVESLRKSLNTQANKIGDKVTDAISPITDTLNEVKKRSWWDKFIKRK